MDNLPTAVDRILLDPLAYIHPARLTLPGGMGGAEQRSVLNALIIDAYRLPIDLKAQLSHAERDLIDAWSILPDVCALIGAQLLKAELAWGGAQMSLPHRIRRFASFPVRQPMISSGAHQRRLRESGLPYVQAVGLEHLLAWQKDAAPALRARVKLPFAPEIDAFAPALQPDAPGDVFLVHQAIQYAKNHPVVSCDRP
ncbi:hypothetical protein ACGTRS_31670 [Burkholderia semiarida]|uniref:Type III secretion apparatus protein OrgA/MxiK n=1 Tax=Burkholderia semiarida TaxID=2843303 RepID=A0ABW7LD83_9BURK